MNNHVNITLTNSEFSDILLACTFVACHFRDEQADESNTKRILALAKTIEKWESLHDEIKNRAKEV